LKLLASYPHAQNGRNSLSSTQQPALIANLTIIHTLLAKQVTQHEYTTDRRFVMAYDIQDYFETDREREEGHTDTRSVNFECDNKDPNLGCNLGIDVAG
jgi:hypothetical protein